MDQPGLAILANSIHSMTSLLTVLPLFAWLMQPRKTDEPKEDEAKRVLQPERASELLASNYVTRFLFMLVSSSVRSTGTDQVAAVSCQSSANHLVKV